jgi:hypothetical protein
MNFRQTAPRVLSAFAAFVTTAVVFQALALHGLPEQDAGQQARQASVQVAQVAPQPQATSGR